MVISKKKLWHGQGNSAGDSKRKKKEMKTEKEVGRQHQGLEGLEFGRSVRQYEDRVAWRHSVETSTVVPQWPSRLRD